MGVTFIKNGRGPKKFSPPPHFLRAGAASAPAYYVCSLEVVYLFIWIQVCFFNSCDICIIKEVMLIQLLLPNPSITMATCIKRMF